MALLPLSEAGYPIFLLDDSISNIKLPNNVQTAVTYRRRVKRLGAKAGNLNDWLNKFGNQYTNIVLLDADSIMSVESIDMLVQASESPDNSKVAIFQSKVEPYIPFASSLFPIILGLGSKPRARVTERVHGRHLVITS